MCGRRKRKRGEEIGEEEGRGEKDKRRRRTHRKKGSMVRRQEDRIKAKQ